MGDPVLVSFSNVLSSSSLSNSSCLLSFGFGSNSMVSPLLLSHMGDTKNLSTLTVPNKVVSNVKANITFIQL